MPNLTQFQDDNPILVDTPIHDTSAGMEAMAKTVGAAGHELAEMAGNMAEQQSNAMYAQSQAKLDTMKTDAKILMIKNPGQANAISDKMAENYSQITDQALVNKSDRLKLKLSASKDFNDIREDAARADDGFNKRKGAVEFYTNFPTMLSGIVKNAGDQKEWENRVNSTKDLVASAILNNIITPKQGEMAYRSLDLALKQSNAYIRAAGGQTSSRDYHQLKGGVIPIDDGSHMGQPVDHTTGQIYDAHQNDLSEQTLKYDIANGRPGNPEAWFSLKDKTVDHLGMYADGSRSAYADLNNGTPYQVLANDLKSYENRPLSSVEEGRKAAIESIMANAGRGGLQQLLNSNPIMREVDYKYNQSMAVVNQEKDPAKRYALTKSYTNDLFFKRATLAEAMHWPSENINPLDESFIGQSQGAWAKGQDVGSLLHNADFLDQPLKEYLARGQSTPLRQEVTRVVANSKDGIIPGGVFAGNTKITDEDRSDFVRANQEGNNFSDLKLSKSDSTNDMAIKNEIQGKITDALRLISNQYDGSNRGAALVEATTNLVKYYAQKNQDYELDKLSTYTAKAAGVVNAAYPLQTGMKWKINQKDIPATPYQMDVISDHLINDTQSKLEKAIGVNQARARIDGNSLSITSTPTGHLVVVDSLGNHLMEVRYNGRLAHYASGSMKEEQPEEKSQAKPELKSQVKPVEPEKIDEEINNDMEETEKWRKKGEKQGKKLHQMMEDKNA